MQNKIPLQTCLIKGQYSIRLLQQFARAHIHSLISDGERDCKSHANPSLVHKVGGVCISLGDKGAILLTRTRKPTEKLTEQSASTCSNIQVRAGENIRFVRGITGRMQQTNLPLHSCLLWLAGVLPTWKCSDASMIHVPKQ